MSEINESLRPQKLMIVLIITLNDLAAAVILTTPCKVPVSGFDQGWGRDWIEVGVMPSVMELSMQRGNRASAFKAREQLDPDPSF